MKFLYVVLGVSLSIMGYFFYKFQEFRQNQMIREQVLNTKVQTLLHEAQSGQPQENIFREMAIDEISKQTLIYDASTGVFVRRKQIH